MNNRRKFIKYSSAAFVALQTGLVKNLFASDLVGREVSAHLWIYASRFPPNWDCSPMLDEVFSDLKYAGYSGVELMDSNLKNKDAVDRLIGLQEKHQLKVSGSSYSANMWNKDEHGKIADEVGLITDRLQKAGGKTFGISVGYTGKKKTEEELDNQAFILKKVIETASRNNIETNMHNHTYEMEHDMFDFKGTIARVPELKLGPDLNWLVRAKVDPVWFIQTYGEKIVYMHIRDQMKNGKWTEAVGEGDTDFKAIAKILKEINYNKGAAVELAFEPGTIPQRPVKESWKMSREYVARIFGW